MGRLLKWAPCVLGGVAASAAFVWFFGYGARWIARSRISEWFFKAEWPVLPPVGWAVAVAFGLLVVALCRLMRA